MTNCPETPLCYIWKNISRGQQGKKKAAVNLRFPVDRFGAPKVGKGWSWFPADKITMSENKRLPGDESPFFFLALLIHKKLKMHHQTSRCTSRQRLLRNHSLEVVYCCSEPYIRH